MRFDKKEYFSIRKTKLGVGSVLLGFAMIGSMMLTNTTVSANEVVETEPKVELVSEPVVEETTQPLDASQPEMTTVVEQPFAEQPTEVVPEIELPVVETEKVEKEIPRIPTREEAFPEEGRDIPTDRTFRAAGDVINKSEFTIGVERNDTGKATTDFSDLNGNTINLALKTSIQGINNVVNGAKLVIDIPDFNNDNSKIIRASYVSAVDSRQTVDKVRVTDEGDTPFTRFTVNLGNQVSGANISIPVILESRTRFADTMTENIKFKLTDSEGTTIVEGNKDVSWMRDPLPKTSIELESNELTEATNAGAVDVSKTNPVAYVGKWSTNENKPRELQNIYYNLTRNLYTTSNTLSLKGLWNDDFYVKVTIPDDFRVRSGGFSSVDESTISNETSSFVGRNDKNVYIPIKDKYHYLVTPSIDWSNNTRSSSGDLWLQYEGTDKRQSVDFKVEVINKQTGEVLNDLTTTYSHKLHWVDFEYVRPTDVPKGEIYASYSTGSTFEIDNNDTSIKDDYLKAKRSEARSEYSTSTSVDGQPNSTSVPYAYNRNDDFAVVSDSTNFNHELITLKGKTYLGNNYVYSGRNNSDYGYKTQPLVNKIEILPPTISTGGLGDFTWSVDRIITPSVFSEHSDVSTTGGEGQITGWRHNDVDHDYSNIRVYRENIKSGQKSEIGRLGDLLDQTLTNTNLQGIHDKVTSSYSSVKKSNFSYNFKTDIVNDLTQDEKIVLEFNNSEIIGLQVDTAYKLSKEAYKSILKTDVKTELSKHLSYNAPHYADTPFLSRTSKFDIGTREIESTPTGLQIGAAEKSAKFTSSMQLYRSSTGSTSSTFINSAMKIRADYQYISSDTSLQEGSSLAEDMKYLIDLPVGIEPSNFEYISKDSDGSQVTRSTTAHYIKTVNGQKVYEVVIPKEHHLRFSSNNKTAIQNVSVHFDANYNSSIIPSTNNGEAINWQMGSHITLDPSSSVKYSLRTSSDKFDLNDDGNTSSASRDLKLYPTGTWLSDTGGFRTVTLLPPKSVFIYNKNSDDNGTNFEFETNGILAGRENPIKTIVFNNSEVEYTNMTVISTLPKAGDDKFDGSEDRGSNITPTLKEAVTAPQGWTVEYTMTEHADGTNAKNLTGWVPASSVTNFSNVKAIRYKSSPGTILRKGDVVEFPFTLNVPANARPKDKMVSTSAIAVNGSTEFLEGYRTISTVYTPTGSVEVKYEDEAGLEIKPKVIDMPSTTEVDTEYNTDVDRKPTNIEFNGKNYNFLKVKQGSEPTTGRVKEGVTTVTYVYKEGPKYRENTRVENGNITIKYVDENNVTLKEDVVKPEVLVNTITEHVYDDRTEVASTVPSNAEYDIDNKQDKPDNIEFGGIAYRFDRVKDAESLTGKYIVGNKEITLIYTKPAQTQRTESGNVVIKYVDREGNELKSDVTKSSVVVNNIVEQPDGKGGSILVSKTPTNARYDIDNTTDKPATLDKSNIRYTFAEVKDSTPLSDLYTVGTKEITLIYDKTPTETREEKGHVKVRYVDTNDREISSSVVKPEEVVNRIVEQPMADGSKTTVSTTPTGATYDVNADKKNEIRFDNKLYRFSRVKDTQPTGNLTVGETVVTYVYDVVTGDVEVKYVDTEGHEIKHKVTTHDDAPIKSDYDVNAQKDNEIEFGGKVYRYTRTDGNPTGKVTEETTTITYVYDVVKGDVEVKYESVDGVEIKSKVLTHDDVPIKSQYDVNAQKDNEIEFDGKVYRFTRVKDTQPTGEVKEGLTTVTYVYDVVRGDVEVKYINTDGEEIKDKITTHDDAPIKSDYDVNAQRDNEIEHNGKVYRYTRTDGNPTGKVTEETTTITYVYELVTGDVEVKYVDTEGNEIKDKIQTHDDAPVKSDYDVTPEKDNEIEFEDKLYRYVRTDGSSTGKVTEETTTVTYVYDVVKGDVVIHYTDMNGNVINDEFKQYDQEPIRSRYNVLANRLNDIDFNGKVYRYRETDGKPIGKIVEGVTHVTFKYDVVVGDVIVNYTDTSGVAIKESVVGVDDKPIKSLYDVTPLRDNEIEFGGKVYRYTSTTGDVTGKVTESPIEVTYVYDVVVGDVEVKYVDVDGNEIKDKITTHDNEPIKSDYDVNAQKDNEIEHDGKVYRYTRTDGNPTGKVTEETTTITYVYDVVKGDVEVKYVDTDGHKIKDKILTHDDAPIKSDYDVTSQRDNEIEFDGKVYRYMRTDGNPTGKVTEDTTTITYVYKVVTGDVEVEYVDVDGNTIKDKITTHDDEPIKSDYDVNDRKENEIEYDGKVYRYTRTDGNPTGKVTEETTKVTYVYDVVNGDVEVKYVDVEGNELKDSILIHDDVPIKSDYDVTSRKDQEIETNGTLYRYVRTDGEPTGKVVEGKTTIIYVYDVVIGDVEVEYVDVNGNPIKDKIVPNEDEKVYTPYDVTPHLENEIEFGGKVYRHTRTDGEPTGKVTEKTTKVTYVYDVVKGDVMVKYVDVNGNTLKEDVIAVDDSPIKSDYNVTSLQDQEIKKDDLTYRYVRTDGEVAGKVTENTTVITYVYDVVKGDVEVVYVDLDGNPIKDKITTDEDKPVDSTYDVTPQRDRVIEKDGQLYRLVRTDGNVTGKITEDKTTVVYVYELIKGSVNVKHVDVDGNELVDSELVIDNQPVNSDYSVESSRRVSINKDGKKYQFTGKVTGDVEGKVKEGLTTIVFEYGLVDVPTDYPTIEKLEGEAPRESKVPTDYPTIEKPEGEIPKESKVPNDYPTIEKPEGEVPRESKVPNDYPTIEKPEGEIPRESKVPTDYPTIEKPEGEIPRESKVPNDYPTVELPEGNVPVIPGVEVPEVPEKLQTPEVPVTPEKPQKPETPVQVTTTVVESNGKQLPKTGDAGLSVSTLFAALSSIASGLFVGFRKKKDD